MCLHNFKYCISAHNAFLAVMRRLRRSVAYRRRNWRIRSMQSRHDLFVRGVVANAENLDDFFSVRFLVFPFFSAQAGGCEIFLLPFNSCLWYNTHSLGTPDGISTASGVKWLGRASRQSTCKRSGVLHFFSSSFSFHMVWNFSSCRFGPRLNQSISTQHTVPSSYFFRKITASCFFPSSMPLPGLISS